MKWIFSSRRAKVYFTIGILFVCIGILTNEWILGSLFSPDGNLALRNRILILAFNIFSLLIGLSFILKRNSITLEAEKSFLLFFITSILCLIVGEIFLRIWLNRFSTYGQFSRYALYEKVNRSERKFSPHHYLSYSLTENYISKDGLNKHNSQGYRGNEIVIPKPEGIFRIAAIGGSTTYTSRVHNYKKSFPVLLQKVLNEKYNYKNIEVINAGVGGYNSWECLINLQFRVLDIEPDLLIIYLGTNDVHSRLVLPSLYRGDNSGRRKPWSTPERKLQEKLLSYRILRFYFTEKAFGGLGAFVDAPTSEPGVSSYSERIGGDSLELLNANPPKYFERNLRNMIVIAKEHNIKIILSSWAYSPLMKGYSSTPHYQKGYNENNVVVKKVAENHNIPLIDFAKMMPVDTKYWFDGRHVNEEGALVKAEIFAEFIHSQGLIPK